MHSNPFSPSFSIRPERFFGRDSDLTIMREAVDNPDSPYRFLFVTGTRGCGKTSLLHQFSLVAHDSRWETLETTYHDALDTLLEWSGARRTTTAGATLQPSVSAAGISASAGSLSVGSSKQAQPHLSAPFVGKLSRMRRHRGLMVTIDEVQKISEGDMEEICQAVQAAKTQGLPVSLVLAGLPASYSRIRAFPGCTFIQRMRRRELGLLTVDETLGFLRGMFALVPEIEIDERNVQEVAAFCAGHPYLLQLVGSHVYEVLVEAVTALPGQTFVVSDAIVREAEHRALADYQENVLRNLLSGLRNGTLDYLRALCDLSDETSAASTTEVASALGKTPQECSATRARVIDLQLAIPVERGRLQLALPYLPLAFSEPQLREASDSEQRWIPRKLPFE